MSTMLFGYVLFVVCTIKHLADCVRNDAHDSEDLLSFEHVEGEFTCRARSNSITDLIEHKNFTVQDDVVEVHDCLMAGAFNMVFAARYQGEHVALRILINNGRYSNVAEVPENAACINAKKLTAEMHHVGSKHFIPCLASGVIQAEDKIYAISIWPLIQGAKSLQAIGKELLAATAPAQITKVLSDNGVDPKQVAEQIVDAQCALVSAHAIHDDFNPYNMMWKKDNAKGAQLIIIDYDKIDFDPEDFDLPNDILSAKHIFEMLEPFGLDVGSYTFCDDTTSSPSRNQS